MKLCYCMTSQAQREFLRKWNKNIEVDQKIWLEEQDDCVHQMTQAEMGIVRKQSYDMISNHPESYHFSNLEEFIKYFCKLQEVYFIFIFSRT